MSEFNPLAGSSVDPGQTGSQATSGASATIKPLDEIRDAVTEFLQSSGENMQNVGPKMQQFLDAIAPEVELALVNGDLMSMNYIRDRVMIQLGRVSLGTLHRQREIVAQTVATVVRLAIKLGITALA